MKKIKIAITSILVFIIITLIYFIIANVKAEANNEIASFFSYSVSYVPTNSMEPTISKDSTILFKKVDYDSLNENDILVYYNEELDKYIIHRAISKDESGYVMKGDNNITIDTLKNGNTLYVNKDNYIGKYITTVSMFSITSNLSRNIIFISSIMIFIFIILSEILYIKKEKDESKEDDDKEKLREELIEEIRNEINNHK